MTSIYDLWPDTKDNLEAAERYASNFLLCGWAYTSSLTMPDYAYEDYEQ